MTGIGEVAAGFSRECGGGPRGGGSEERRKFRGHVGKGARHRDQLGLGSAGGTMPGSSALGRRAVLGLEDGGHYKNVNLAVRREAQEGVEQRNGACFHFTLWQR